MADPADLLAAAPRARELAVAPFSNFQVGAALLTAGVEAQVIGKQLLRSGTSVGAHYREGYRARSTAEFVSKFEVALQELDESKYWMELLVEGGIVSPERLAGLKDETDQLIAIL